MPKNNLDRLRYQVLQNNEIAINNFQIATSDNAPTMLELEEKNFNLCYLYDNQANTKGWRHDGFRTSWDCKSHWSFPMRGKLKRKIDKIVLDPQRELHRWATQINHLQSGHTFVEYFLKTKGKPITFSNLQISYPEGVPSSPIGTEAGSSDSSSPSLSPHNSPSPPSSPLNIPPPELRKTPSSSSSSLHSSSLSSTTINLTTSPNPSVSSHVQPSKPTPLSSSSHSLNYQLLTKTSAPTTTTLPLAVPTKTTTPITPKPFLGESPPNFPAPQPILTTPPNALWNSVLEAKKPDYLDNNNHRRIDPFVPNRSGLQPEMIRKGEHPLFNVQNPLNPSTLKGGPSPPPPPPVPLFPMACSQTDVITNWISQQSRTHRNIPNIYTSLKASPDKMSSIPAHNPNPTLYSSPYYQINNNDVKIVGTNHSRGKALPVNKVMDAPSPVSNVDRMMSDLQIHLTEIEKLNLAAQQKLWSSCCENTFFEAPSSGFTPPFFFRRLFEEWSKNTKQHMISIVIFHQTLKLFVSENQNFVSPSPKFAARNMVTSREEVPQSPAKRQRKMEIEALVS